MLTLTLTCPLVTLAKESKQENRFILLLNTFIYEVTSDTSAITSPESLEFLKEQGSNLCDITGESK